MYTEKIDLRQERKNPVTAPAAPGRENPRAGALQRNPQAYSGRTADFHRAAEAAEERNVRQAMLDIDKSRARTREVFRRAAEAAEEQNVRQAMLDIDKSRARARELPASAKLREAEKLYDDYLKSDEYKRNLAAEAELQAEAWLQASFTGNPVSYAPKGDPKEQRLKALVDHYRTEVKREADRYISFRDQQAISRMDEKDLAALDRYIAETDIEYWAALNPEAFRPMAELNAKDLFDKYGRKTVINLAETRRRMANEQNQRSAQLQGEAFAQEHPVAGFLASRGANFLGSVTGLLTTVQALQQNTGRYSGLDTNTAGNTLSNLGAAMDQANVDSILGEDPGTLRKSGAYLYRGAASGADSLVRSLALGPAGGALAAASGSFNDAVNEATARGASPDKAVLYGASVATAEYFSEKIPLDNLAAAMKTGGHSPLEIIKNMAIQAGVEMTTEEASFVAGLAADAMILRESSRYRQRIGELVAQGVTPEAAKAQADAEIWQEAADTAIVSMIAGGMSEAGASIGGNLLHRDTTLQQQQKTGEKPRADEKNPHTQGQKQQETGEQQPDTGNQPQADVFTEGAKAERKDAAAAAVEGITHREQPDLAAVAVEGIEHKQAPEPRIKTRTEQQLDQAMAETFTAEKTAPAGQEQLNIDNAAPSGYNNTIGGEQNDRAGSTGEDQGGVSGVYEGRGADAQRRGKGDGASVDPGIVLLKPETREKMSQRGIVNVELRESSGDNAAFSAALANSRQADTVNGWAVTLKSREELDSGGVRTFMDERGATGFGIAPDGDIVAVFANKAAGAPRGATKSTIPMAIANGGKKLDCYGTGLVRLYAKHGFVPVARTKFNPEYANDGWTPEKGTPDIYFMMYSGEDADTVAQKYGTYPVPTPEQLAALPEMEYDDAFAYRDKLLAEQEDAKKAPQSRNGFEAMGAADRDFTGKAAYQDLLTDDNVQPDRPGDVRPMEIPRKDGYGRDVSEFAANAYGAEVTPDRMANEIERLIQDGALGFDRRSNEESLNNARDAIYGTEGRKGRGEAGTLRDIRKNIDSGKVKDGDIEKALLLYARFANRKSESSQGQAAELMVDLAAMAHMTGRNLQLFKLLRRMTPEGQLMTVRAEINRNVDKMVRSGAVKKGYIPQISPELEQEYLEAAREVARLSREQAEETEQEADWTERQAEGREEAAERAEFEATGRIEDARKRQEAAKGRIKEADARKAGFDRDIRRAEEKAATAEQRAMESEGAALLAEFDSTGRIEDARRRQEAAKGRIKEADARKAGFDRDIRRAEEKAATAEQRAMESEGAALLAEFDSTGRIEDARRRQEAAEGRAKQAKAKMTEVNREIRKTERRAEAAEQRAKKQAEALKNAEERLRKAQDAIYQTEAAKMPATFKAKWDAWRYMCMLGNAKTNIRNVVGNLAMVPYTQAKRVLNAAAQKAIPKKSRTAALVGITAGDRALQQWARKDAGSRAVNDALAYSAKLGDDVSGAKIQEHIRVFKNPALETLRKVTEAAPAMGDMLFKKREYSAALASFLKARGVTAEQLHNGTADRKILDEGRNHAINEAMKATFNDCNAFSDYISSIGRSSARQNNPIAKAMNLLGEGVMPFRRTPANIVVRFAEYSPAGLVKGIGDLALNVRSGKVSAATAIDEICAGLTGSGMAALGYFLASMGMLRGSDVDEDEERRGHQQYALEFTIDGEEHSYAIDWAAPANLPLFLGANLYSLRNSTGEDASVNWFTNFARNTMTMFEPMLSLSCLSSLNDLFESARYAQDGSALYSAAASAATSYFTQGIPALLRQADQAAQENKQKTYANSPDPLVRGAQRTAGNLPFIGDALQTDAVDEWGGTESRGGKLKRVFDAFFNPGSHKTIDNSDLEEEISRLQEVQPERVTPPDIPKTISYTGSDGQQHKDYRLTAEEYNRLATVQGQTARETLEAIIETDVYRIMTDEQKAKVFDYVYDYAREKGRTEALDGYQGMDAWMEGIEDDAAQGILNRVASTAFTDAFDDLSDPDAAAAALDQAYEMLNYDPEELERFAQDSGGRVKYFIQAKQAGISAETFVNAYKIFRAIDGNTDLNTSGKAEEWSYQLQKMQEAGAISQSQKNHLKDSLVYYQMFPAETAKFDAMTEAGISADKALDIGNLLEGIKPQEGYSGVRDVQKAAALAGADLTPGEKMAVMKIYLSDAQDENLDLMIGLGYTPEDYAAVYEIYANESGTGKKKRTIGKIQAALGVDEATAKEIYEIYG